MEGKPGTGAIRQAFEDGWLKLEKESSGTPSPTQGITGSDAEVLSVAENRGAALLTNDRALFHCAKARGIRCKWLSLVVGEGIEEGLLTPDEAEKILTDMVHAGLRIRSEVFAELISRIRSL